MEAKTTSRTMSQHSMQQTAPHVTTVERGDTKPTTVLKKTEGRVKGVEGKAEATETKAEATKAEAVAAIKVMAEGATSSEETAAKMDTQREMLLRERGKCKFAP